jgi:hypothetical protein
VNKPIKKGKMVENDGSREGNDWGRGRQERRARRRRAFKWRRSVVVQAEQGGGRSSGVLNDATEYDVGKREECSEWYRG